MPQPPWLLLWSFVVSCISLSWLAATELRSAFACAPRTARAQLNYKNRRGDAGEINRRFPVGKAAKLSSEGGSSLPGGALVHIAYCVTFGGLFARRFGSNRMNRLAVSVGTLASALRCGSGTPIAMVVSALILYRVRNRFYDTTAVKTFIQQNTDVKIFSDVADFDAAIKAAGKDDVCLYLKDDVVMRRLLLPGANIALGETYMEGLWETNDLVKLLVHLSKLERFRLQLGWRAIPFALIEVYETAKNYILPSNTPRLSRNNVKYHYDLSAKMFERQLGPTMQYTCAYYHRPGMSLDEAQLAKMRLVAHKLDLKPGMRIVEMGCGYGALAYLLATEYGVHVTGVSLSDDQVAYAKQNFAHPNVDIRLQDYRNLEGVYDRVYSVGLMEHIGRKNYGVFFDKAYDLLKDDGIMFIHTLGWGVTGPWNPNTFMFKYIWPGAEMPHASAFTEKYTDQWHLEDWQNIGKSYSPSAVAWYDNLVGTPEFEEMEVRFQRMWKYYLLGGAASVECRKCSVWQLVFTKFPNNRANDCHHIRVPPFGIPEGVPKKSWYSSKSAQDTV